MEHLDKLTKFLLLEEYYYDNIGGNLDIIKQTIEEINRYNLIKEINDIKLFEIIQEIKKYILIDDYNKLNIFINRLLQYSFAYIPILIPKHLIGMFFYKTKENYYDVSIINTGDGILYQKIFIKNSGNKKINYTNGIIIFRDIKIEDLFDFLQYILYLVINYGDNNDANFDTQTMLDIFYRTIFEKFLK